MKLATLFYLFVFTVLLLNANVVAASGKPKQFDNIALNQISHFKIEEFNTELLSQKRLPDNPGTALLRVPLEQDLIDLPVQNILSFGESHQFVSQQFEHFGASYKVLYTQGKNTAMGEVIGGGKHLLYEVRDGEMWQVDLRKLNLSSGIYDNDTLGFPPSLKIDTSLSELASGNDPVVVDVMLLFTPNIQATYPGEMSFTLMHHLVAKANQAFVDSDVSVLLRLVRSELVEYTKPSSRTALSDILAALDDDQDTVTDISLDAIKDWRSESGADIVAMIRTHNLNEREVCGMAVFPGDIPGVIANVSNVGISGGSNCLNTFTHEIGHNFGAGHQHVNGQSVGQFSFSGAFVLDRRLTTVMASFGTGTENRDYKLPVFSNLTFQCGGGSCGDSDVADNATTMNMLAAQNAAISESILSDEVSVPVRSQPDTDGDGMNDWLDMFPHFPDETLDSDGDGVGDNADVFPNDNSESLDTDGDGVGNNQDTDDDNDGVDDIQDDLPLNPNESQDTDNDGTGDIADALPNDFQEFLDGDQDGIGDLGDVDDDNDGVHDFHQPNNISHSNILVASANTHQIIEFDASTGEMISVAATVANGGLSFRSDMAVSVKQQLYFIAFSDVYRLDRQTGSVKNVIDRSQLATNFPVHIAFRSEQRLVVNNGLGNSVLEGFSFTTSGNTLATQAFHSEIWRDFVPRSAAEFVVASRSTNELRLVNPNLGQTFGTLLSNAGLDKPEHIAIDQQGQIYTTNAGSKNISAHSANGDYLGEFITAGSGGLGMPGCIGIGPDGNIYVCSTDTDQILKFDGETGAFDSVVVDTMIDMPVSIAFVGKPLDELPFDGDHDSDGDGVVNAQDDLPLDASETTDTDGDGIGNEADSDDDGDSMPDSFETEFGLDPLDPTDANGDADGDGVNNLSEFNQGTDPTVADNTPPPVTTPPPAASPSSSGGGSMGVFTLLCLIFLVRRVKL